MNKTTRSDLVYAGQGGQNASTEYRPNENDLVRIAEAVLKRLEEKGWVIIDPNVK